MDKVKQEVMWFILDNSGNTNHSFKPYLVLQHNLCNLTLGRIKSILGLSALGF